MKKRNGFVSNSSSSSFVILGVDIEDPGLSTVEIAEKLGLMEGNDKSNGYYEDECYDAISNNDFIVDKDIGRNTVFGVGETGGGATNRIDLFKSLEKLESMLGKLEIEYDKSDIKVFGGERYD